MTDTKKRPGAKRRNPVDAIRFNVIMTPADREALRAASHAAGRSMTAHALARTLRDLAIAPDGEPRPAMVGYAPAARADPEPWIALVAWERGGGMCQTERRGATLEAAVAALVAEVAAMDVPATHHGRVRPATKYSSMLWLARPVNQKPMVSVMAP